MHPQPGSPLPWQWDGPWLFPAPVWDSLVPIPTFCSGQDPVLVSGEAGRQQHELCPGVPQALPTFWGLWGHWSHPGAWPAGLAAPAATPKSSSGSRRLWLGLSWWAGLCLSLGSACSPLHGTLAQQEGPSTSSRSAVDYFATSLSIQCVKTGEGNQPHLQVLLEADPHPHPSLWDLGHWG